MSFLEELEKRKENLSMNREELALYAAKRQSLLTGLKGRMFQASPCTLFRTEYLCGSSGEGCRSTLEKSRKDCIFVRSL